MKSKLLYLLTISLFMASCRINSAGLTEVTIWDTDFQVVRTIDDTAALAEFNDVWEDRIVVSLAERPQFSHKVDVVTGEGSTRWLYHPGGYATVLSKTEMSVFQFRTPKRLQDMLIPPPGTTTDADEATLSANADAPTGLVPIER